MSAVETQARFAGSGGELAYTDAGDGPPVLLLHTVPLWSLQWRRYVPQLAARHRVIAPDLLGAGDSEMPTGAPLGPRAQAGYVRELLMHLGIDRFAVVGHGVGGAVAQLLALETNGVDAMVLIDAPSPDDAASGFAQVPRPEATASGVAASIRALVDAGARHRARIPDDLLDAYAAPYREEPAAFLRMVDGLGVGDPGEPGPDLGSLAMPVLLLWGEEDPIVPPHVGEALNEAIGSSTLGLLPGCGHFLTDEAEETILPMIAEYLRAMYLRAPHGHADPKEGVVMLQLERRPPWVDLAEDEADDWFVDDDEEGSVP